MSAHLLSSHLLSAHHPLSYLMSAYFVAQGLTLLFMVAALLRSRIPFLDVGEIIEPRLWKELSKDLREEADTSLWWEAQRTFWGLVVRFSMKSFWPLDLALICLSLYQYNLYHTDLYRSGPQETLLIWALVFILRCGVWVADSFWVSLFLLKPSYVFVPEIGPLGRRLIPLNIFSGLLLFSLILFFFCCGGPTS